MKFIQPIKYIALYFLTAFSMLFFTGCLSDDEAVCPDDELCDVTLDFLYDFNMDYEDIFKSVVDHLDIYAYDNTSGKLVDEFRLTKRNLEASGYKAVIQLPQGSYNLVSWMNAGNDYECIEKDSKESARLKMKALDECLTPHQPEDVYYGKTNIAVTLEEGGIGTISYKKNTKFIQIYKLFNNVLPSEVSIESYISGTNGIYDFENNPVPNETVLKYMPQTYITYAAQTNRSDFKVQRLWKDDDMKLYIVKKEEGKEDEVLKEIDLTYTIMQNPSYNTSEKLDRQDVFSLSFEFNVDPLTDSYVITELYIDDWKYIESNIPL